MRPAAAPRRRADDPAPAAADGDGAASTSTSTTLTNPGIVRRLERDIADYLSPFGFRLERRRRASEGGGGDGDGGGGESGGGGGGDGGEAALVVPRLPRAAPPPLGTLRVDVHDESLLATVGPLLRTYLRLSPGDVDPRRLRAAILCRFVLDASPKFDKMSSEQKRKRVERQEEASARRMCRHVHLLVRNSMGSALCLDLVVALPRYARRSAAQLADSQGARARSNAPIGLDAMKKAMRDNPDACYPSVRLVEQNPRDDDGEASFEAICDSTSLHVHVRTRMCTVRAQPPLFRWLHSLRSTSGESSGVDATGDGSDSADGESLAIRSKPRPARCSEAVPRSERSACTLRTCDAFAKIPLIVACIEKVANMHRMLMLCLDYEKILFKHKDARSSLLANVLVVMPNARDEARREFEEAIDHFREVAIGASDDELAEGRGRRPTLVREGDAAEVVRGIVRRRRSHRTYPPSVVGIDLHPDALALRGDYAEGRADSDAVRAIREADAVAFGYESDGIPDAVREEVTGWVEIPSRSSINVVAAMSIVLDALFNVDDGADMSNDR